MTFENFLRSWQACIRRRPFRPYRLQFITGETITILHPEAIRLYRQTASLVEPTGQVRLFDAQSICQFLSPPLSPANGEGASSSQQQE